MTIKNSNSKSSEELFNTKEMISLASQFLEEYKHLEIEEMKRLQHLFLKIDFFELLEFNIEFAEISGPYRVTV